jgi:hypothetical protein
MHACKDCRYWDVARYANPRATHRCQAHGMGSVINELTAYTTEDMSCPLFAQKKPDPMEILKLWVPIWHDGNERGTGNLCLLIMDEGVRVVGRWSGTKWINFDGQPVATPNQWAVLP